MGQVGGIRRSRIGRAGFVAGAIGALLLGLTAPAWACNAIVTGSVDCSSGQRVVHWSIGNDQTTLPMTIVHALSSIGSQYYPTTGWASGVAPAGSTSATTAIPDGVSGTLTLNVYASWPTQPSNVSGGSVFLGGNCPPPTTTTTTTTAPPTTTTTAPPSTTTTYPPHSTTTEATTTTYPSSTTYPETSTSTPAGETSTTYGTTTTIGALPGPTTTVAAGGPTSSTEVSGTTIDVTSTTHRRSTTTVLGQGATVPTVHIKGSTSVAGILPRTGSSAWFPIAFAVSFLVSGVLLIRRRRRGEASAA